MNDRKVFIVDEAGHNFSGAEKFGELIILNSGSCAVFAVDRMTRTFNDRMEEFRGDRDYILLTGNLILNVIAMGIAMMKGGGRVKMLLFDARRKVYIERELDLTGIEIENLDRKEVRETVMA